MFLKVPSLMKLFIIKTEEIIVLRLFKTPKLGNTKIYLSQSPQIR